MSKPGCWKRRGNIGLKGISDAIAHAAEAWDADFWWLEPRAAGALERLVIGSVAEQLDQRGNHLGFTFSFTLT